MSRQDRLTVLAGVAKVHLGWVDGLSDRVDGEDVDVVRLVDGLVVDHQTVDVRFHCDFFKLRFGPCQVVPSPFDQVVEPWSIVLLHRHQLGKKTAEG